MGYQKLTGGQAILGGIAGKITLSTSSIFYNDIRVQAASTDATKGGIRLGGATQYIKKIALTGAGLQATTSLTDTGWDAPYGSIIEDAFVDTVTAATSATDTLDVGIAGDPNGLLSGIQPVAAWTPVYATYGVLLFAKGTSDVRLRVPYQTKASTTRSITVSRSATVFSATWTGNLFIKYLLPA